MSQDDVKARVKTRRAELERDVKNRARREFWCKVLKVNTLRHGRRNLDFAGHVRTDGVSISVMYDRLDYVAAGRRARPTRDARIIGMIPVDARPRRLSPPPRTTKRASSDGPPAMNVDDDGADEADADEADADDDGAGGAGAGGAGRRARRGGRGSARARRRRHRARRKDARHRRRRRQRRGRGSRGIRRARRSYKAYNFTRASAAPASTKKQLASTATTWAFQALSGFSVKTTDFEVYRGHVDARRALPSFVDGEVVQGSARLREAEAAGIRERSARR